MDRSCTLTFAEWELYGIVSVSAGVLIGPVDGGHGVAG